MSANLSPDQVREKHKAALPADTGALYHALYNSLTTAFLSWIIFKDLFAKSEARVALLNRTASTFFLVLSETLRRDVLLAIARITDSATSGRDQENATIDTLVIDLLPQVDDEFGNALKQKASELALICKPIRTHRNKTLAHSDKLVALADPDAPLLPGITMADVDAALQGLAGFLNTVSQHFDLGTVFFEDVIHVGGADSLVHHLHSAEAFHEATQRAKKDYPRSAEIFHEAALRARKESV